MDDLVSRRDFLKHLALGASSAAFPGIVNRLGRTSPSSDTEFLEIRDGRFYLGGEEFMIKGANYLTRDYPWLMFEEYDSDAIDHELSIASGLGVNAVRVGLMFPHASGSGQPPEIPLSQIEIQEDYFRNFESFLQIAANKEMKVLPIALDWPRWELYKPSNFVVAKEYLEGWLPDFKDDERILAWEIATEPELIEENFVEQGISDQYDVVGYIKEMIAEARSIDEHHPITVSIKAVHNEKLLEGLSKYVDNVDFMSFHCYYPIEYVYRAVRKIRQSTNKPIFLEEFGLPTGDEWQTEAHQKRFYSRRLEATNRENIAGVMFWELNDHPASATSANPFVIEDDYIKHMGILRTDYSQKPAAHVVQQYYKWWL